MEENGHSEGGPLTKGRIGIVDVAPRPLFPRYHTPKRGPAIDDAHMSRPIGYLPFAGRVLRLRYAGGHERDR